MLISRYKSHSLLLSASLYYSFNLRSVLFLYIVLLWKCRYLSISLSRYLVCLVLLEGLIGIQRKWWVPGVGFWVYWNRLRQWSCWGLQTLSAHGLKPCSLAAINAVSEFCFAFWILVFLLYKWMIAFAQGFGAFYKFRVHWLGYEYELRMVLIINFFWYGLLFLWHPRTNGTISFTEFVRRRKRTSLLILFLLDTNGMFYSSYTWKLVLFYMSSGLIPCAEATMRMGFPGMATIGGSTEVFALKLLQRIWYLPWKPAISFLCVLLTWFFYC